MPRFDGTGPRGQGPMTGRGEGYCAVRLPESDSIQVAEGYAGLQGTPVRGVRLTRRLRPATWLGRVFRRGRDRGRGRGRGRRW